MVPQSPLPASSRAVFLLLRGGDRHRGRWEWQLGKHEIITNKSVLSNTMNGVLYVNLSRFVCRRYEINNKTTKPTGISGCLVISAFQIPGHFQVLQDSFSRSYETKKLYAQNFYTLLLAYIKIFSKIFY